MEWRYKTEGGSDDNVNADIGFIPLLQVKQIQPSSPAVLDNGDGTIIDRRLKIVS